MKTFHNLTYIFPAPSVISLAGGALVWGVQIKFKPCIRTKKKIHCWTFLLNTLITLYIYYLLGTGIISGKMSSHSLRLH